MAFIGSDGLDRQLKQLKTHLASKLGHHDTKFSVDVTELPDSELTSIRNEQRKRTDELNEAKKAREAVQYQVSMEGDIVTGIVS